MSDQLVTTAIAGCALVPLPDVDAPAAGEKAETLEFAEITSEPAGHYFRDMKALSLRQPCLECHGPAAQLTQSVRAQRAAEYPFDRAIGYAVGQVRGAPTIKRPLWQTGDIARD